MLRLSVPGLPARHVVGEGAVGEEEPDGVQVAAEGGPVQGAHVLVVAMPDGGALKRKTRLRKGAMAFV